MSCVPASCFHIWLFPVLVSCHYELIRFQVCDCDCVNYPVYLILSVEFHVVWSTRYSRCFCVSALPCLTLMLSLKTIILKYLLVCVFLLPPCCVHHDTDQIKFFLWLMFDLYKQTVISVLELNVILVHCITFILIFFNGFQLVLSND